MSAPFPPEKIHDMMSECTIQICDFMYDSIISYFDKMPDIEENKIIFADSVIAGSFVKIILDRTKGRPSEVRRKYVRKLLDHAKSRAYELITMEEGDVI